MKFSEIPGLHHIKNHLQSTLEHNRTPHAQLFVGKPGNGALAMAVAFAQQLICQNLAGDALQKASYLCEQFTHPDMHFVYPVNKSDLVDSKKPLANDFAPYWREFLQHQVFEELHDWYKKIGIEKKQGLITVSEAEQINKHLALKSYGGHAKVMMICFADKLHASAANKLLKLIEEPPENTYFILISEHPEEILLTIRSRCQSLDFPPFSEEAIAAYLEKKIGIVKSEAHQVAAQSDGDLGKAIKRVEHQSDDEKFEAYFISWVRSAFQAKKKKSAVRELMLWAIQIDKENRDTQIRFIEYCLSFFRQALLQNYNATSLVYMRTYDEKFKFSSFSKFINGNNIVKINTALSEASYHIKRNANGKVVFSDLSLQLTRFIHQ